MESGIGSSPTVCTAHYRSDLGEEFHWRWCRSLERWIGLRAGTPAAALFGLRAAWLGDVKLESGSQNE